MFWIILLFILALGSAALAGWFANEDNRGATFWLTAAAIACTVGGACLSHDSAIGSITRPKYLSEESIYRVVGIMDNGGGLIVAVENGVGKTRIVAVENKNDLPKDTKFVRLNNSKELEPVPAPTNPQVAETMPAPKTMPDPSFRVLTP